MLTPISPAARSRDFVAESLDLLAELGGALMHSNKSSPRGFKGCDGTGAGARMRGALASSTRRGE